MDDKQSPPPNSLPTVTPLQASAPPSRHLQSLADARDKGRTFGWMGLGLAFLWWGAAFGGTVALIGLDQLSDYSAAVIAAGAVALAMPGFMLVLAGMLARENARAASTNAVVLEAAARLLAPLEKTGSDATVFAELMKKSAADVDRSMAHALSSMKAMAGEIADERQRLESVSYVTADNAKELSKRLGDERRALETLASDINKQTEMMGEAIPRQAAQMRDSARAAAADIAQADQALEIRLENLNSASASLTEKVSSLDTMSVEAAKRSEELIFAVARMEEKLEESRRMVDKALRAGEMAAASASTTGDRLTDAVNAALDRARIASRDIQSDALDASERAAKALAALKAASLDATAAARQLKSETGLTDEQIRASSARLAVEPDPYLHDEPSRVAAPTTPPPRGPSQPTLEEDDVFDEDDPPASTSSSQASAADDVDLFDSGAAEEDDTSDEPETIPPAATVQAVNENEAAPASMSGRVRYNLRPGERKPVYLKPVGGGQAANLAAVEQLEEEDEEELLAEAEAEEAEIVATAEPEAPPVPARQDSQHWRDIIADMERDEHETLPREENADEVIHRLLDSGIRLNEIFRPRDKKKIAHAARKSEGLRRKAVVDAAARQVQRVQKRLDSDRQLMTMAREFLAMEEPDALMALDKTCNSSKNASPRLAAFMLIDAALG